MSMNAYQVGRWVCIACLGFVMNGLAADNIWQAVSGDFNGDYADLAHWNQNRIPTTNDTMWTSESAGATYTMTFPKGYIPSWANWRLRSRDTEIVTLDGRGSVWSQEPMDVSYSQWYSGRFDPNLLNLERNGGGAQLTNAGLQFQDFLLVLSNKYHVVFKQGTFDFSRNGGRCTSFTGEYDGLASITVEPGAKLITPQYFDWRSVCRQTRIDVNGGTLQGKDITHPTSEGHNTAYDQYFTDLRVRKGGTVTCSGSLTVGNNKDKSSKRLFTLEVGDEADVSFSGIYHSYGGFALEMTGGILTLADKINVANGAGGTASLVLTGGEIRANQVNANTANGTTFHADGGMVVPRQATTAFLQGFGQATLGAGGLTVRTDYSVTVAQNFTNADGQAGRLVKTGSGTLTLTGTATEIDTLELRDGGLVLGNGAGIRAKLLVVNGRMPTLTGSARNKMLTGLTLGDEKTVGRLAVQPDAPLTLDGPLALPRAELVLDGAFTLGNTYDLIVAKGPCPEAVAAWRSLIISRVDETDRAYELTAVYDEESGMTTFSMTVSSAVVSEKQVSETGTSDAAVNLGRYDTYRVTVAEGAAYSFLSPFEGGYLEKDGPGWMWLATDALAPYLGVRLTEGTLAFRAPCTTLPVPLRIQKADGTTVVHTEDDVVLKEMTVTSGGWIKHGPGTLTIENDGSIEQTLTATNGMVQKDGTPGWTEVRLGPDYPPPVTSWTGLSIAEGTVHLKGTGPNVRFRLPHSVAVGMPTRDGTVQPRLVVEACEAWTGNNAYHFFLAPNTSSSAETYFATSPELVVTNGAKMRVDTLCVGDKGSDLTGAPKMVVDGSTFLSGFKLQFARDDRELYHPEYEFRNQARVYTAYVGSAADRKNGGLEIVGSVTLTCDASVIAGAASYTPEQLYATTLFAAGAKNESTLLFRNGASFWCWQIVTETNLKRLNLVFDDATWEFGVGTDLCVEKSSAVQLTVAEGGLTVHAVTAEPLRVRQPFTGCGVLTKTGSATLRFEPRANWNQTLGGAEPCADDAVTLACDVTVAEGALEVAPGAASGTNVVTLTAGTSLNLNGEAVSGLVLAGAGTVAGGTLQDPVLKPAFDAAWASANGVLTLASDCAVSGRLRVDLGYEAETPLPAPYPTDVLVARYQGATPPDVADWGVLRTAGTRGLRGVFTAADGEIRMTVKNPFTLILLH